MNKRVKFALAVLVLLAIIAASFIYLSKLNIAVLNPKGLIALKERRLMIIAALLMLIVVLPVFVMTIYFAWKYRAGNPQAEHKPDWDNNHIAEAIWWGVPCIIITALAIVTWKSTHELDPYKPLDSDKKPLVIQVVALQWKWLFIYPEQKIATINFVQFPENVPLDFEITADAPMNSFWIPQLGGQIYAMPSMKTQLHLIAHEAGTYNGLSANLSGDGFAGMTFSAKASTEEDFNEWVKAAQQSSKQLDLSEYNTLAQPSKYDPVSLYQLQNEGLFSEILMKYGMPM